MFKTFLGYLKGASVIVLCALLIIVLVVGVGAFAQWIFPGSFLAAMGGVAVGTILAIAITLTVLDHYGQ